MRKQQRAEELRLMRPLGVRSHELHQVDWCFVPASRLKQIALRHRGGVDFG
jgi:hypothetical protein